MRVRLTCGAGLAVVAVAFMGLAADVREDEGADAQQDVRRKRLEWLQARADEFEIYAGDRNGPRLKRGEKPILRWSNPVREFVNDGVAFLYFDGARPPADNPSRRLVQLRDLARRFHASSYKEDGAPNELRLLAQPLHRYHDDAQGILDGALFAFAEGNDAEALLLVEATVSDGGAGPGWRYALARMTAYRVVVRLDEQEVFVVEPYWKGPRKLEDPYTEARDSAFDLSKNGRLAGESEKD